MGSEIIHIRLKSKAESRVRSGHPWVFSDSIAEQSRPGRAGDLAVIFDHNNAFLAIGFIDPDSPIRLRVIHRGKPRRINADFWRERFQTAVAARAHFSASTTNGYRWVHGENDGFPGLVLDRYDQVLVLKLYSAIWFPLVDTIAGLLRNSFPEGSVILRLSRNIQETAAGLALKDGQALIGSAPKAPIIFQENGIRFEADVVRGQKTGFFLDQRENRERVETLAMGQRVLNAFSFSGGFSLYAARGGAKNVISLDISQHALESAKRNFGLNPEINPKIHQTVQANVFEWLKENRERFDLIILDPPSLAKRETERAGAVRAYEKLAQDGIARLDRNGILAAASCSAHVTADEFWQAVLRAAAGSGRTFEETCRTGHPADHPATFKEAQYLKCIYLRFDPFSAKPGPPDRGRKRSQPHR